MINVTESARQELTTYFKGKAARPIRIQLTTGGCTGTKLMLALDNRCCGDRSVTYDDLTFLINERLAEATGDVFIDTGHCGFSINSERPVGEGYDRFHSGGGRNCGE
ncbi:heme biosynthesis protein HemY [Pseudodesulfovibrio cashew]|uniref:Heme biosynthesis protein HemY n=1 Tax=Pseudodesulfovibrio cashew TaxID=2678688 RepID=A0A6I6JB75_9BACT|nr:heme biosynthesis protein HemY [Pseudodesulfovibrio cashew]QGY40026.1 heme biosynthesis protein HemY [Pseudodesulfovibrio cashew]